MRVSESLLYHQALTGVAKQREQYAKASEQASSGKRVEHVWDAPADAGLIFQQGAQVERQKAVAQAAGRASDETAFADQALASVNTALQRAQELAVQMANDTYSAADRQAAAAEAAQLLQQVVAQGNARFGDVYVFGGYQTGASPFDAKGNYAGDSNQRLVEIAPGVTQPVSLPGDQVFNGAGGGVDLPKALTAFVGALQTNNLAGIQQAVADFGDGVSEVALARAKLGAAANVFDAAVSTAQASADAATKARSNLEDADAFDSATLLAQAEQALTATVTATAKQLSVPNLAEKL